MEPCRKQHMTVSFLTVCILRLWRAHLDLPTLLKNYSLAFKAASVLLPPSDAIEMLLSRALQVLPSPKYIKPKSGRKQKRQYESKGECSGGNTASPRRVCMRFSDVSSSLAAMQPIRDHLSASQVSFDTTCTLFQRKEAKKVQLLWRDWAL